LTERLTKIAAWPRRQLFVGVLPFAGAILAGATLALVPRGVDGLGSLVSGSTPSIQSAWTSTSGPTPAASSLISLLRSASAEGLDPARYPVGRIEAQLGRTSDETSRARAERLLSDAFLAYARDLRVPTGLRTTYIDPELAPSPPNAESLLASGNPAQTLKALQRSNPLYEGLRAGLARYRARWSKLPQVPVPSGSDLSLGSRGERVALLRRRLGLSASADPRLFDEPLGRAVREFRVAHGLAARPVADSATIEALNAGADHYERLIIANMDRTRGLPVDGRRYLLVDTAGAKLRMIEEGRQVDEMRVVVGKPAMETPELAGLIRFAVVNPYWNVPPDLVRNSIAPAVLRDGPAALARRRLALFPDWRSYERLEPEEVDWAAVAAGRESVWVRQLPGGDNMMGDVKFMLPNRLGIYLHDTPRKSDFARSDRMLSSGCVRVEDARRLARWIFRGGTIFDGSRTPDKRVDLPEPVPVYITYLTAVPEAGEIRFQKDVYKRDPALLSRLGSSV
jgi:murein L,D-transpeptidase YcbB/YkuD